MQEDLEKVYKYFPRLKERRGTQAGYTSGGEQQMTAIGRALMARPKMILLDEPSMGLAPQLVEEIFQIVQRLNREEKVSFLLAEQNTHIALRYADYGYILENGRVVMDGEGKDAGAERGREGVLPRLLVGRAQELPRREVLPPAQALAVKRESFRQARDALAQGARGGAHGCAAEAHRPCEEARARLREDSFRGQSFEDRARGRRWPASGDAQERPRRAAEGAAAARRARTPRRRPKLFVSPGPIHDLEGRGDELVAHRARTLRRRLPRGRRDR